jgi:hypothetical protein
MTAILLRASVFCSDAAVLACRVWCNGRQTHKLTEGGKVDAKLASRKNP